MNSVDFELDINNCLDTLRTGGLILYPTDTVWGIGCDATDEQAVQRIIHIKHRPDAKSFVILAKDLDAAAEVADSISEGMIQFREQSSKPVTFILNNAYNLAPSVINSDGTVAVRIPTDEFCLQLLHSFGKPIVSTSANISGSSTPAFFRSIEDIIRQKMDYIALYRQEDTTPRQGSTIIKENRDGEIVILRP